MDQLNHSLDVNALVSWGGDAFMESNALTSLGLSFKPTKFKWVQNLLTISHSSILQARVMILKTIALQHHWSEKLFFK